MHCPDCGKRLSCLDTRKSASNTIRRRYQCACGKRFTSWELIVPDEHIRRHGDPLRRLRYALIPDWDKLVAINDKIAERLLAVCRIKISDEFRQEIADWLTIAPRTGTEVPETKENEDGQ